MTYRQIHDIIIEYQYGLITTEESKIGTKKTKQGFTLVELIVVLVILAVLAALLVPSLTQYIDKAREKSVIAEARDVWTAAQAAMSECYALYPESFAASCKFTTTINGEKMSKLGRITNGALGALQRNPNDKEEANTSSRKISRQVLIYLESADKNNPRYDFGIKTPLYAPSMYATPTLSAYLGNNPGPKQVAIQIFHTIDGRVVAINFGKDGYMVTIVPGKEPICEKNGKLLYSAW